MRKFDFDNLDFLTSNRLALFSPYVDVTGSISSLELSFAAPFSGSISTEMTRTLGDDTQDNSGEETFLTNGDDTYITIMDGEHVLALDGDDLVKVDHDNVTVEGGNGNDLISFNSDNHIFGPSGSLINASLNGGEGYDIAEFQLFWIPGLDVFITLDVTDIDFTNIEEIVLDVVVHPTDSGPGGAGGMIFDDFFDINYSQLATISHLDIDNNLA